MSGDPQPLRVPGDTEWGSWPALLASGACMCLEGKENPPSFNTAIWVIRADIYILDPEIPKYLGKDYPRGDGGEACWTCVGIMINPFKMRSSHCVDLRSSRGGGEMSASRGGEAPSIDT